MPAKALQEFGKEIEKSTSGEDFSALEEKIYRTIELLKSAREGKAAAEREARRLREQIQQRADDLESLRAEVLELRKEREEIRARVEKALKHIDHMVGES